MRRVTWEATLVALALGGSGCSNLLGLDPPVLVGADANQTGSDAPRVDVPTCT